MHSWKENRPLEWKLSSRFNYQIDKQEILLNACKLLFSSEVQMFSIFQNVFTISNGDYYFKFKGHTIAIFVTWGTTEIINTENLKKTPEAV